MLEALSTRPLAATAQDHAFLAERIEDAARDVWERGREAAGEPLGLLLVGSLARGEGTVWRGAAGPFALSDVDFALVLPDEAARGRAAAVAPALARALAHRLHERGVLGGCDLGVYTPERLARQERRPGTLEARRGGRVLFGPAELASRYPAFEERDVPPEEALVLLENRGAELLLAWPGADAGADPRAALRIDWAVFVTEALAPAAPPMPVASTRSWLGGPVPGRSPWWAMLCVPRSDTMSGICGDIAPNR